VYEGSGVKVTCAEEFVWRKCVYRNLSRGNLLRGSCAEQVCAKIEMKEKYRPRLICGKGRDYVALQLFLLLV